VLTNFYLTASSDCIFIFEKLSDYFELFIRKVKNLYYLSLVCACNVFLVIIDLGLEELGHVEGQGEDESGDDKANESVSGGVQGVHRLKNDNLYI